MFIFGYLIVTVYETFFCLCHVQIQIPQENINHVSKDVSGGLQAMETALTTQQSQAVQANSAIVKIPGGTPLTISGGRLVLANG
jgi:hypothetical protein